MPISPYIFRPGILLSERSSNAVKLTERAGLARCYAVFCLVKKTKTQVRARTGCSSIRVPKLELV